jgi:peptidoglycan/xylan/chitin deacetylase (PgdA/CDA1 family)
VEAQAALKRSLYLGAAALGRAVGAGRLRGLPDRPNTLRVLMYHKVTAARPNTLAVAPPSFEAQQQWLNRHYTVVSLDAVRRRLSDGEDLPRRAVLLTFDDGYLDNLHNAHPVLERLGHRAVLFVPTDFVGGKTLPHDERVATPNPTLAWDDVRAMQDVFEVGSHACSHRRLAALPRAVAVREITESKRRIEDALGVAVRAFSYPRGSVGDFGPEHVDAVENAGYDLAFTTLPGVNGPAADPFRLRRHNVEDYGLRYFQALLDGSADLLALKDTRAGYRLKGWVNRGLGAPSA